VQLEEKEVEDRQRLERGLSELSSSEQTRLRKQAVMSLTKQGIKRGFMLEGVIRSEMLRLMNGE